MNTSFIFVWALYSLIIQYVLEWLILTRVIFVQERLYSLQHILCFGTVFNEISQCCLESYFAVPDSLEFVYVISAKKLPAYENK